MNKIEELLGLAESGRKADWAGDPDEAFAGKWMNKNYRLIDKLIGPEDGYNDTNREILRKKFYQDYDRANRSGDRSGREYSFKYLWQDLIG